MGKGKKNQQFEQLYAELEPYMSDSDDETAQAEEELSTDELFQAEVAKAVIVDNLPVTTPDKVSDLEVEPGGSYLIDWISLLVSMEKHSRDDDEQGGWPDWITLHSVWFNERFESLLNSARSAALL